MNLGIKVFNFSLIWYGLLAFASNYGELTFNPQNGLSTCLVIGWAAIYTASVVVV
jgi:hypothetical protein